MLQKTLAAKPGVEMHHEYAVAATQKLGVQRYLGLIDEPQTREMLQDIFGGAIAASTATHWGDSSNKLSWLIADLAALFPTARFVHLVRDGRKVASSYFHKLGAECYGDDANAALQAHYDDPAQAAAPPSEKPFWWPVPRKGSPDADAFRGFDQFQRIAWHWAEINRVIFDALAALPPERSLFVRLEDLRTSPSQVRGLYQFLSIVNSDSDFAAFARPHNVNRPEDRLLDARQTAQFDAIADGMMQRLGYAGQPEYRMKY
jgi:Sulfotransferase family